MVGPRVLAGSLPPLFERLMDLEPHEVVDRPDARHLRGGDARVSVLRALAHLLDTRRHVGVEQAAQGGDLTVLDYGVPDLGNRAPADPEARYLLSQAVLHAVRAFEPRLLHPTVEVTYVPEHGRLLAVCVSGAVSDGAVVEPVIFQRHYSQDAATNRSAELMGEPGAAPHALP